MTTEKQNTAELPAQERLGQLEITLQYMAEISLAENQEQLDRGLRDLLGTIGEYTHAQRSFFFTYNPRAECYRYSYEWCADHTSSQQQNFYTLSVREMPQWHRRFTQGRDVIYEDIEDMKGPMPLEYEILRQQNVQAEISMPIFAGDQLWGFVGLDNPSFARKEKDTTLLRVIAGHIGSAVAGLQTRDMLRHNTGELEKSIQDLENERKYLSVLTEEYTSVYSADLIRGTVEILKLNTAANASRMVPENARSLGYMDTLRRYAARYVKWAPEPGFLEILAPEHLMEKLRDRERFSFRYVSVPDADGYSQFEVVVSGIPGEPDSRRVLIGFRHVDEIVRAEQERQAKLEAAFQAANQSNEIISAIGKIYVSIYAIDLTGDTLEELSSSTAMRRVTGLRSKASDKLMEVCDSLVSPEHREHMRKFFDLSTLAQRIGQDDTTAAEYIAVDQNWRQARFIVKSRDENGMAREVLYCTRTISDEKRRERNWIDLAAEASRSNAAKSDFLSRMAHDIRTPLNAVLGFVDITRAHLDEPERMKEGLSKIKLAGEDIRQLVNDVLDLSKIESGALPYTPEPTDLGKLFEQASATIQAMMPDKRLRFHFDLQDISENILVLDPIRLNQIYMNLLSNAVKYTPEGGEVFFEVWESPSEKDDRVKLLSRIRDTGIGMSNEYLEQMYERFSRAVDTRVNKVRGSGLGLAIVRQLVDMLKGDIQVESQLGKGTTFTVTLEFPYASAGAEAHREGQTEELDCAGMHLLVAEDNDLNYEVAQELLGLYGITCQRAENGQVCVELFQNAPEHSFDAILMDMQMPVMGGVDATMMIRSLDKADAKTIPIIAMTANAFTDDSAACLSAGMNVHLAKPLDMQKLLPVLHRYRVP